MKIFNRDKRHYCVPRFEIVKISEQDVVGTSSLFPFNDENGDNFSKDIFDE